MPAFKYNSARATTEFLGRNGMCEAVYTGPMTEEAFDTLRTEALQASVKATSFVVRLDRALILMPDANQVHANSYPKDAPAGALIVRRDQFEFWAEYVRKLASFGVCRSLWLEETANQAYLWADLQSRGSLLKSQDPPM